MTDGLRDSPIPLPPMDPDLLDLQQLEPFVAIGREDYLDILGDVERDVPDHLQRLCDAIRSANTAEVKSRAHATRGMLSHFGLIAMTSRLAVIEHQETPGPAEADGIHRSLVELWNRSYAALKAWEASVPELR